MKINTPKTFRVLITGANRGLGLVVADLLAAQGHKLVLTARRLSSLEESRWPGALFFKLDVSDPKSIARLLAQLRRQRIHVDILINNAGYHREKNSDALVTDAADIMKTFATNTLGPFLLSQGLLPAMIRRGFGRIVNVSSQMGRMNQMAANKAPYRVSKAALNAVTKIFAEVAKKSERDVLVNAMSPGWVRTDMGGRAAPRSVEKGAMDIVWVATLKTGAPSGKFYFDRRIRSW
jgi:NAD(P)-dependent dehydrogenase (short-subunit alcohol dehydrogenase family)